MDLSNLAVEHSGEVVALPTISVCVYFSKLAHEIARSIAEAIDAYRERVGHDRLRQYSANSGEWRTLTTKKLDKDLAKLRAYPPDLHGIVLEYNSDDSGRPGPYGIYVFATEVFRATAPLATNFLRLDFAVESIVPDGVDGFVAWYSGLLERLPFHSSHAGYAYKRVECSKDKASRGVDRKISRYYGFDPGYEPLRDKMLGRTGNPQWLNAIDEALVKKLGGAARISTELPESKVTKLKHGLLIQGAPLPPLGDVNRGASDVGSIPEIARLFKPLRTPVSAFRGPLDAQEWLARYDEMDNRPWNPSAT